MHFPAIYSMQNFDAYRPSGPPMTSIRAKLKLLKFYRNFSRYSFEKLIRTLNAVQKWTIAAPFRVAVNANFR